jgi:hypothetical protein
MRHLLKLSLLGLICVTLRADILRLRDGRMVTGNFLGATRTEIWFQRDTPGDIIGAAAYPVEQVESLTFGPAMRQSNLGSAQGDLKLPIIFADRPLLPLHPSRPPSQRP